MEIRHYNHDPNAPAWYMSLWFLLIVIFLIVLVTMWFAFARNAAEDRELAQAPDTTMRTGLVSSGASSATLFSMVNVQAPTRSAHQQARVD